MGAEELEKVRKDNMFDFVSESWNPVTGCKHFCYGGRCWAKIMNERFRESWGYDFSPRLHEDRLDKDFGEDKLIFVSSMGDLFGEWVPEEWILKVISSTKKANESNTFFFQTKNPKRFADFTHLFPKNSILATTIETNRKGKEGRAPLRYERYRDMLGLIWHQKFVSIEPIMDFDLDELVKWIKEIHPMAVAVGYDNYGAELPEPPLEKTKKLIKKLDEFTEVHIKELREKDGKRN